MTQNDSDIDEVLENLPVATLDWAYGLGEQPNAFVYVHNGKLNVLPTKGGHLLAVIIGADVAPFAD